MRIDRGRCISSLPALLAASVANLTAGSKTPAAKHGRARRRVGTFLVGIALAVAVPPSYAAADSKVDLTEYVMPQPLAGDFKTFDFSDAASRTLSVLSVVPWKASGWHAVLSQEDEGLGTASLTQFVVPSKKALIGEIAAGDLAVDFDRPRRLFKLRVVPGKLNRFQMSGTAFVAGNPVGPGRYRGIWQLVGFEDLQTPTVTWPGAARVHVAASLRVVIGANGNVLEATANRTVWFARDVGEVASEEGVNVFLNGVLQDTFGPRNGWLDAGTWKGAPIP